MKSATMPPELVESQHRRVRQLQCGETGYISFTALHVNRRMKCLVEAKADLRPEAFNTVEVRRDENGPHVVVPSNFAYRPAKVNPIVWWSGLLPVASITVAPGRLK
jgi:hypothetical protein